MSPGSDAIVSGIALELHRVSLFADLDRAGIQRLSEHSFVRRLGRGQVLFTEGEPSDHLFVVRSGRLRVVVRSARGDELLLTVVGAGEALGELSAIDRHPRSAGADAIEATEVIAVPAQAVHSILLEQPAALMAVACELAAGMRRLTGSAADLVFLDLARRLAKLLVVGAAPRGDGTLVYELSMSQSGVAARLGTTRQSLNRALADLQRRRWVTLEGTCVRLTDAPALQRFASS